MASGTGCRIRRVEHIMGLPISMDVRSAGPAVPAAASRAFDWLREVNRRFSPFREGSEVWQCGRELAAPAHASAELIEIIDLCLRYERDSGGAFRAWLPGRPFDPCGVVKGWAVQRAGDLLRTAGADRFCLKAGGDVLAVGAAEPGRAWRVGIRHPEIAQRVCAIFDVRDCAVATSGNYERGGHVIDGRTGHPARELLSLTVPGAPRPVPTSDPVPERVTTRAVGYWRRSLAPLITCEEAVRPEGAAHP
ncbi:FAD:protein FMN transferase [Saccharopolyspora sp. 5N708]|uniref:FAD:protein FMN transferase n=1 Tax=Saccharopolyspora sp. 5N708 TaxID=3457424 RepID=UPI003FD581DC